MPKVMINDKEYDTEELPEEAVNRLRSIQFVDGKISELRVQLATYQTARNSYARSLSRILEDL